MSNLELLTHPSPVEISREEESLRILWSHGVEQRLKLLQLRFACHCAVCRESQLPPSYTKPFQDRMTSIKNLETVGNYALGILWMDGHRSILPYERIQKLRSDEGPEAKT